MVGGCWLLISAVARQAYPLAWNYLAVAHVSLDLLVAAAMVAGVVMAVDSVHRRRVLGLGLRRLAPSAALGGVVRVDLSDPPAPWSGAALGAPTGGEDELCIAATGRQPLLGDTCFTRAEIHALEPGTVVCSVWEQPDGPCTGNEQVPLADFADIACTDPGRNG